MLLKIFSVLVFVGMSTLFDKWRSRPHFEVQPQYYFVCEISQTAALTAIKPNYFIDSLLPSAQMFLHLNDAGYF